MYRACKSLFFCRFIAVAIAFASCLCATQAADYRGRVVDEHGAGVPYATVYLTDNPVVGTATNNDGFFVLSTDVAASSQLTISFIGYEKFTTTLSALQTTDQTPIIALREQPVALQEMVVAAKASKQKNKRKQMAQLLYKVYNKMQYDFAETATMCQLVSDVRMNADNTPWGMEQMIAKVVNIPGQGRDGADSVQFAPEYCKRFFQQQIRNRADTILAGDRLDNNLRKMANEVDSGVVVHKALWAIADVRREFEHAMNDLKHWAVSNESAHETVLTYTENKNYLGIFKYRYRRHFIVDSDTYRILRFAVDGHVELNIPFGYRFREDDLELLNLLNLREQQIEKFRLRHAVADGTMNTIYSVQNGHVYPCEKNLKVNADLQGTRKMSIPIEVKATQHAGHITPNAAPLSRGTMRKRVKRQIVPIY